MKILLKHFNHLIEQINLKKHPIKIFKDAFEDVTGEDLNWFFDQWVNRTGAPELSTEKC